MKSQRRGFCTFILSSNTLASTYLCRILAKDPDARPVPCDRIPDISPNGMVRVFVIDLMATTLPISECVGRLLSRCPEARIVAIDNPRTNEDIGRLLRVGVHGFVEQGKVEKNLRESVHAVAAGRYWVSDEVLTCYVKASAQHPRSVAGPFSLTQRESQIAEFVSRRLTNREIADILGLKESTVKFHVSNVFEKLHVEHREDLAFNRKLLRDPHQL